MLFPKLLFLSSLTLLAAHIQRDLYERDLEGSSYRTQAREANHAKEDAQLYPRFDTEAEIDSKAGAHNLIKVEPDKEIRTVCNDSKKRHLRSRLILTQRADICMSATAFDTTRHRVLISGRTEACAYAERDSYVLRIGIAQSPHTILIEVLGRLR